MKIMGVLLLSLSIFRLVDSQSTQADTFVNVMEDQVRAIAAQAITNYNSACDLTTTCQTQNCSRQECHPVDSVFDDYACVTVSNISYCTNSSGPTWNEIQANFGRSYIRTPPLNSTYGLELESYGQSICTQRELDPVFKAIHSNITASDLTFFFNLYFGAIDGAFRYYPGREVTQPGCGSYDLRVRPWFTGAISVLKDIVVLIDTGYWPATDNGFLHEGNTALDNAKILSMQLFQTLVPGDRFTLVPFNASGVSAVDVIQVSVTSDTNPNYLASLLQNPGFGGSNSVDPTASNFSAGFQEALNVFNTNNSTLQASNYLKIVMVFTDINNYSPTPEDLSSAQVMSKEGQKLFFYDLGSDNSPAWISLACGVEGYFEQLKPSAVGTNPLLSLNAYFSFLSRSRIVANGNETVPFWQNPYTDASGLEEVITVSFPAMSQSMELIGVAAIDIQVAGLGVLGQQIAEVLQTTKGNLISISLYATGAELFCNGTSGVNIGTKTPCPLPDGYDPLCEAPLAANETLINEVCFGVCVPRHHTVLTKSDWAAISIGIGAGFLLLFVLPILFLTGCPQRCWRKHKKRNHIASPSGLVVYTFVEFSYYDLKNATNNFSRDREIGRGRYGTVYRGILREGSRREVVAVKRMKQPAEDARDFQRERQIMGIAHQLKHENIVELKGICLAHPTECFLVYELVELGDLSRWLWPEDGQSGEDLDPGGDRFLSWEQRIKIAEGVASGLHYLHEELPSGHVYHLDIKPQNILLDRNFNPKIADFGISRFHEVGYTWNVTNVNAGTPGYIAPELFEGSTLPNSKLDTFSYGMVLLQLFCRRKIDDAEVKPSLRLWAFQHESENDHAYADRLVDPQLIESVEPVYADSLRYICMQMIELALLCLSDASERPDMSSILDTIRDLPRVLSPESSQDAEEGNLLPQLISRSTDLSESSYFTAPV